MGGVFEIVCRGMGGLAVLTLLGGEADAASVEELYQARVHVTGQEEPARSRGFAAGLRDVLVKLSGDPKLVGDPVVDGLATKAGGFVRDFRYRDLMAGIPVHDEQGTRQRPFVLTIDFDPAKIDRVLQSLGRRAWTERPRLAVFVGVDYGVVRYVLAADGMHGRDQREALAAAAWRYGIPIVLPNAAQLGVPAPAVETLQRGDLGELQEKARAIGGDLVLAGALSFVPATRGWTAEWRLAVKGVTHRWSIAGVTFDEAFRSAMLGAAQILSAHGSPE